MIKFKWKNMMIEFDENPIRVDKMVWIFYLIEHMGIMSILRVVFKE